MQQGRYIVADNGFTVADLQPMGGHNACLIAAAPELLAALQSLMQHPHLTSYALLDDSVMQAARNAINKATGENK